MLQPKITSVKAIAAYKLQLVYETGEIKLFDATPYIKGSWFGELADYSYFSTVMVLPDGSGVAWPNGQDLAPHELYENSVLQN